MSETTEHYDHEPARDCDGMFYHPIIPWDRMPEEEDVRPYLRVLGYHTAIVSMDGDAPDDLMDEYADGSAEAIFEWEPSRPQGRGWFLASICDTKDGPQSIWLAPIEKENGSVAVSAPISLPTLPSYADSIIAECHAASARNGWWSDLATGEPITRNRGECLCLIHSEISEGRDADLTGEIDDKLTHRLGAEVELADALIRLGDYLGGFGYPFAPEAIIEIKPVWMSWSGLHSMISYIMEIERKRTIDDAVMRNYMGELVTAVIGAICAYAERREFDIWGAVREKLAYNAQRADHKPENRRQAGGKAW